MIVDITNEVLTQLKTILTTSTVLAEYPSTTPTFPCVTVSELSNNAVLDTKDTSGYNHSDVALEINIFTSGTKRMSDAKKIRDTIDGQLSDTYGLVRDFTGQTPNMDTNIFRYTMRYSGIVDSNRLIYGR